MEERGDSSLTWDRVELKEGVVRLDPGETKNEEGRTLYLNEELMEEMRALQSKRHLGCPYVFHRNGQSIKDFRGAWDTACIKAGLCEVLKDEHGNPIVIKDKKGNEEVVKVPTKIFHDFRRTAIRDMVRSGVSERVAMKISGHRTRSVFDRYNIVSDQDLRKQHRRNRLTSRSRIQSKPIDQKRGEIIQLKQVQNESQKNFNLHGHSLGTVTIKSNKKGISLCIANPLIYMVPEVGLEPARGVTPRDFKSLASTNSATQAFLRDPSIVIRCPQQ